MSTPPNQGQGDVDDAPFSELAPLSPIGPRGGQTKVTGGSQPTHQDHSNGVMVRLWAWAEAAVPLLILLVLAGVSWWLVRLAPVPAPRDQARFISTEPDFEMRGFSLRQYDKQGQEVALVRGALMRHWPIDQTVRIDDARLSWLDLQGIAHEAEAKEALTDEATTKVELRGGAKVTRQDPDSLAEFQSEVFQIDTRARTVLAPKPVSVHQGGSVLNAQSLRYDRGNASIELLGLRGSITPGQ